MITAGAAVAVSVSLILGHSPVKPRIPDWAAFTFIAVNVIAMFFSIDRPTSLLGEPLQQAGVVGLVSMGGIYAVARLTITSKARLRGVLAAIVSGATVVAGYGLLQALEVDPIWNTLSNGRLFSLVGQPNWLGAYLVLTIPLTASLAAMHRRQQIRVVLTASVMMQLLVLGGTLSRASWVGFTVSLLVGVAAIGMYRRRGTPVDATNAARRGVVVGGLVVVMLLGINLIPTMTPSVLVARVVSSADLGAFDVQQHLSLWRVAGAIVTDHPLIGTGPDTYAIVFGRYRDDVLEPGHAQYLANYRPESPHNVYLAYAAGAGIVAVMAYMVFLISSLAIVARGFWRSSPISYSLLGIIVALAGHALTDVFMTLDVSVSWLFWALAGAAITMAADEGRLTRAEVRPEG
jgi:O-antigen ligase